MPARGALPRKDWLVRGLWEKTVCRATRKRGGGLRVQARSPVVREGDCGEPEPYGPTGREGCPSVRQPVRPAWVDNPLKPPPVRPPSGPAWLSGATNGGSGKSPESRETELRTYRIARADCGGWSGPATSPRMRSLKAHPQHLVPPQGTATIYVLIHRSVKLYIALFSRLFSCRENGP